MRKSTVKNLFITQLITLFIITSSLIGCTENQRAKSLGGEFTIELPINQKLIEATWKGDNLWYLTRNRRENEPIENYIFKEESSFGIISGSVLFVEN